MATGTVAATLNLSMSELRPATIDRILVIEHDRALQRILRRLLSSEGYEVDVVPDAVAALKVLLQSSPSAVILDLPWAESSGCDLCRRIANLIDGPPLVILSASSEVEDKVLLLQMGASDYLTIPFSPKDLIDRLRGLIGVSRPPSQALVFL
jgi:DNA-binding response OmpR family regulator